MRLSLSSTIKPAVAMRGKTAALLVFLLWLSLFFESFGPAWLRAAALAPLAAAGVVAVAERLVNRLSSAHLPALFSSIVLLAFAAMQYLNSLLYGIDSESALPYIGIIGVAPVIYLVVLVSGTQLIMRQFVNASCLFSVAVISLALCFYIDPLLFFSILELTDPTRGFFGAKSVAGGDEIANVYFPATLLLVPAAVIALNTDRKLIFLVCILALAVAPSRFGVAVLALYALLHFSFRRSNVFRKAHTLSGLVHQASKVMLVLLPVAAVVLLLNLELSNDGTSIRIGHLHSLYDEFAAQPAALSFGFGAGSTFYSEGFQDMTDNIELSQFEILRKYGLFGFTVLIVYIAAAAARARAIKATVPLAEAIGCYFLVAMSNPVLLTFGAMLLYGAAWSSERRVPSRRRIAEAAP